MLITKDYFNRLWHKSKSVTSLLLQKHIKSKILVEAVQFFDVLKI